MLIVLKWSKKWRWLLLPVAILALLAVWTASAEPTAHIAPPFPQQDITPVLAKTQLAATDYTLLSAQTGLGRSAIDELRQQPGGQTVILSIQKSFFVPIRYQCTANSPISREESVINEHVTMQLAPLHDGDILITNASHTFGWRHGHAALVIDAANGATLESVVLGQNSSLQSVSKWTAYPNFLLLRPQSLSAQKCAEAADWARKHLLDVPYDFTVGILKDKFPANEDLLPGTQCAHLVWAAYAQLGYDLDSDGGLIVTPRDIASSPLLEVVQYYGVSQP